MTPTRGSPGPSCSTSGRAASQSTSARASATSWSGEFSAICPVLVPNPRADQASTTNPRAASSRASASTEALLPPNPCATSTAGAGVAAGR